VESALAAASPEHIAVN